MRPFSSLIRDHISTQKPCPKAGTQKAMVKRSSHNTDFSEHTSPSILPLLPLSPSLSPFLLLSSSFLPSSITLSSLSSSPLSPSLHFSSLPLISLCPQTVMCYLFLLSLSWPLLSSVLWSEGPRQPLDKELEATDPEPGLPLSPGRHGHTQTLSFSTGRKSSVCEDHFPDETEGNQGRFPHHRR